MQWGPMCHVPCLAALVLILRDSHTAGAGGQPGLQRHSSQYHQWAAAGGLVGGLARTPSHQGTPASQAQQQAAAIAYAARQHFSRQSTHITREQSSLLAQLSQALPDFEVQYERRSTDMTRFSSGTNIGAAGTTGSGAGSVRPSFTGAGGGGGGMRPSFDHVMKLTTSLMLLARDGAGAGGGGAAGVPGGTGTTAGGGAVHATQPVLGESSMALVGALLRAQTAAAGAEPTLGTSPNQTVTAAAVEYGLKQQLNPEGGAAGGAGTAEGYQQRQAMAYDRGTTWPLEPRAADDQAYRDATPHQ
jgi:hypothetical protein